MGGGAFAQATAPGQPTLNVARLSPSEHTQLKEFYSQKLREYFGHSLVHCPAATPDKQDHGDIDIIVASEQRVDFADLSEALGAAGLIRRSSLKCTLGVPKDGSSSTRPPVQYKDCSNKIEAPTNVTDEEYAQVDIELVPRHLFEWHSFYASYGGMAGLLGHIVHNFGFTISDTGLWLRLRELQEAKDLEIHNIADKDGRLHLSRDAHQVMQFTGLDAKRYEQGLESLDGLYSWLGECRMLSIATIKLERDRAREQNRERKRPVFARFFDEWLPLHALKNHQSLELREDTKPDDDHALEVKNAELQTMRYCYAKEAVHFFAKEVEYEHMRTALVRTIRNTTAASLLKPIIAAYSGKKDKQLAEVVRAFRRYVSVDDNGQMSILETPHTDEASELHVLLAEDKTALRDYDSANAWVKEHWEEVRALERQRRK